MPRSLVIRNVAYRAVASGIITGILLAIARMTGETAPLIFTALGNSLFTARSARADVGPAAHHLRIRAQPLRRAAEARLDRRAILTFAVLGLSIMARVLSASIRQK